MHFQQIERSSISGMRTSDSYPQRQRRRRESRAMCRHGRTPNYHACSAILRQLRHRHHQARELITRGHEVSSASLLFEYMCGGCCADTGCGSCLRHISPPSAHRTTPSGPFYNAVE